MERSIVVRIIFLESRNLQFLWDLIESVLANAEHLALWFVVTVWTCRTRWFLGYPNFKLRTTRSNQATGMNGSIGDWSVFCQVVCIAVRGDHVFMGQLFN